jgi:hypothetical protein
VQSLIGKVVATRGEQVHQFPAVEEPGRRHARQDIPYRPRLRLPHDRLPSCVHLGENLTQNSGFFRMPAPTRRDIMIPLPSDRIRQDHGRSQPGRLGQGEAIPRPGTPPREAPFFGGLSQGESPAHTPRYRQSACHGLPRMSQKTRLAAGSAGRVQLAVRVVRGRVLFHQLECSCAQSIWRLGR